ncbi:hypothetical protein ACB092_05G284800 [Castanea dentata]
MDLAFVPPLYPPKGNRAIYEVKPFSSGLHRNLYSRRISPCLATAATQTKIQNNNTNPTNSNSNKNPENFKINQTQHAHNTNTTCSKIQENNARTQTEHLLQQKYKLKNTKIPITTFMSKKCPYAQTQN